MAARIFLGLSALIWLPYGLLRFFRPGGRAESAGVTFTAFLLRRAPALAA